MEDGPPGNPPGCNPKDKRIRFDYLKSAFFRVLHVDGAFGGVTPNLKIQMALWNERWPIPRQTTHELDAEKMAVGGEIRSERISRDAVVREVECELVMDVEAAMRIRDKLDEWIQKSRAAGDEIQKRRTPVESRPGT